MKHFYIATALVAATAATAVAQTSPLKQKEPHPINTFVEGDTTGMRQAFLNNAPQSPRFPGLPRFAIVGKHDKFYLGIGGQGKLTLGYDLGDVIDNPNDFTTSAIPIPTPKGNRGLFQISGQQTGLFLNFVALPNTDNQLGVYLSANLTGDNYTPSIEQAYLKWRGITAGYAYTFFADMAAGVPTIDYEGPNAFTSIAHALVGYEKSFGKNNAWKVAVALEQPAASFTTNATTEQVNQRVPDIPAYIQYSWANGGSWLRLGAILRNLEYRNQLDEKNIDKLGWGFNLSGSAAIAGPLTAYWQGVFGRGIASYIQDINGMNMDLYPAHSRKGVLDMTKTWAAYGGLQYTFSPAVFCSATYSQVRNYGKQYQGGQTAWDSQYKYAQYIVGNVFWNITPIVQTGIEYLWGRRVNCNGTQGHDNRIQTMIQVSF